MGDNLKAEGRFLGARAGFPDGDEVSAGRGAYRNLELIRKQFGCVPAGIRVDNEWAANR